MKGVSHARACCPAREAGRGGRIAAAPFFNMSRTLSRGKIGPGPSFLAGVRPFSLYRLMLRRLRRVFPTLVFAV